MKKNKYELKIADENTTDYYLGNVKVYRHCVDNGCEIWREYDENENETHYKDSNGKEWWSDTHPDNPKKKEPEYKEPFTF